MYAKASIWTPTACFHPHTQSHSTPGSRVWLHSANRASPKQVRKTRMSSHVHVCVCECVMTARGRNSIQLIGKAGYISRKATVSPPWCQNPPPGSHMCIPSIRYHGNHGAVQPRGKTGALGDTCAVQLLIKK